MKEKPLAGITVVDITSFVTGGFATMILANLGAEVIKIERPEVGDPNRGSGPPFVDGESSYFMTVNYGKESVEINLKADEGREIVYSLVEDADVFVENFRPGTVERLQLDDETLRERNEELIYCSISAFGESGPWSERPGFDAIMQGRSGLMSVTGEEGGQPVKVGLPVTDIVTGMWAAMSVISALYTRSETGRGEYIDLAMFDSIIPWLTKQAGFAFEGEETRRLGTRDPVLAPYQAYEAKDGYLIIAAGNDKLWEVLCEAIGRTDLLDDPRFSTNSKRVEHVETLERELESTLTEKSVDEWLSILIDEYELPVGPVWDVDRAIDNEQTEARNMIQEREHSKIGSYPVIDHPFNFRNSDSGFEKHAPALGESTEEVLKALGYTDSDIANLKDGDVIGN